LPILKIKHGITLPKRTPVASRQINKNVAAIRENIGTKREMFLNVSGQCVNFDHEREMHR
jgi:hypothetical protein